MTFENRGKISVSYDLIKNQPDIVLECFTQLQILTLSMVHHYDTDIVEYTALSPKFDAKPLGMTAPDYRIVCNISGNIRTYYVELVDVT